MTEVQLTAFEHILLGLICLAPSSGYDLKRIFATSPMGIYQPSSGALYPALRRLERKGLVRARTADRPDQHARARYVYEPTELGVVADTRWLRAPVRAETVARDLGLHLMRFVMMEHLLAPDQVLRFLRDLADALAAFTTELGRHAAATDPSSGHARLALDHGLAVHRASLRWTEDTIATLSTSPPLSA